MIPNICPEVCEWEYGFLRSIIPEVVGEFMDCGNFANGFARVRCDHCAHEYLVPFSCRSLLCWSAAFSGKAARSADRARRPTGLPVLPHRERRSYCTIPATG